MISLTVTGMTCAGCIRSVEKAVTRLDPSARVVVDLASGHVDIETEQSIIEIVAAIEDAGYEVRT